MTREELAALPIGAKFQAVALLKLQGLDLGGTEFTLEGRTDEQFTFRVTYLGVDVGKAHVVILPTGELQWSWPK